MVVKNISPAPVHHVHQDLGSAQQRPACPLVFPVLGPRDPWEEVPVHGTLQPAPSHFQSSYRSSYGPTQDNPTPLHPHGGLSHHHRAWPTQLPSTSGQQLQDTHSWLPRGKHSTRVAPLTISPANSVRGCICSGKSLQALLRQGDGQRNQGQLSCPQQPRTPLLDAPFRSDVTVPMGWDGGGQGWASRWTQEGWGTAWYISGWEGVSVCGVSCPRSLSARGRATPQTEQLGLVCLNDMQDTCKHQPQARWHGHGQ